MGVMDRLAKASAPKPQPETKPDPDPAAKRTRPQASTPKPEPKADLPPEADIEVALDELSDEEKAAIVAEILGESAPEDTDPFTVALTATRETKVGGIQFDGKSPNGIQVRVWTPSGMGDLPVEVRLVTAEAKADGQA